MGVFGRVVLGMGFALAACTARVDATTVTYETLLDSPDREAGDFRASSSGAVFARVGDATVARLEDGGWVEPWRLTTEGARGFTWRDDFHAHEPLAWVPPFTTLVARNDSLGPLAFENTPPSGRLLGRDEEGFFWFEQRDFTTPASAPPTVRFTRVDEADGGFEAHAVEVDTEQRTVDASNATLLSDGRSVFLAVDGLVEFDPLAARFSTRLPCTHALFGGQLCTASVELRPGRSGALYVIDPTNALWRLAPGGEPVKVVRGALPKLPTGAAVTKRSLYVDPLDRAWLAVEWSDGRALYLAQGDAWTLLVDRLPGSPMLVGNGNTPLIVGTPASGGLRVVRPVIEE